jgi:hypothetical protein
LGYVIGMPGGILVLLTGAAGRIIWRVRTVWPG